MTEDQRVGRNYDGTFKDKRRYIGTKKGKKNMLIRGGNVFLIDEREEGEIKRRKGFFCRKDLRIDESGRFAEGPSAHGNPGGETVIDASGLYVIPGLVDVHIHGCAGADFSDGDPEGLKKMAGWLYSRGITAFCPTSMTLPRERLEKIFASAAGFLPVRDETGNGLADLVGIHMEGPFLSPDKRGSQNPDYILGPDSVILGKLVEESPVPIRLVTLAPELPGAVDLIQTFRGQIHFSLGHSAATYDEAAEAFAAGADHVTHLFNAMTPFAHRQPGIVGAAAERPDVFAELICDGHHVHPSAVRAAFSLFGPDRILLISDSMRAAGMPDGESELGGQTVYKKGRKALLADGTIAASVSSLMDCLRDAAAFGIPLEDAVLAATDTPARSIGMENEIGCIRPGAGGHAVLLTPDLEIVRVI